MVYLISRTVGLGLLIRAYTKKIAGRENIPKGAPFIAAVNHASFFDDILLGYVLGTMTNKKFHIFVNSRFYSSPVLRVFFNHFGSIRVDVGKDVADEKKRKETNRKAFELAISSIRKGENIGIFPEGGRSPDGKLRQAKTGVARLALLARVPVVPMGFIGTYGILPKGAAFPRFRRAEARIGKPISFEQHYGKENDFEVLEAITTKVMKEIAALTGQEYLQ